MNKNFILLDKNNNLRKDAMSIVKFNYGERDYLVYSTKENEQNCQIFVSKLILNSEGKYFIDDISSDEKNVLSNIVYNLVILTPSEAQKGSNFAVLNDNLLNKLSVKLLSGLPELNDQDYYSNSSIAITNCLLVQSAIKLYEDNLNVEKVEEVIEIPTWTAPVEVTSPAPVVSVENKTNEENNANVVVQEVVTPVVSSTNLEPSVPVVDVPVVNVDMDKAISQNSDVITPTITSNVDTDVVLPNPQVEKLAIVSDPSLGVGFQQPNIGKNKKAGFANTKYIVIGTACLVLAVAVVITAFILIRNMS